MESNNTPGTRILTLQLIAYSMIFVVPAVIIACLLPAYTKHIMLIGGILFFTVTGFIAGWQWDNPDYTAENRVAIKNFLSSFAAYILVIGVFTMVLKSDNKIRDAGYLLLSMAAIPASILLPFYLARAIHRRSAPRCPHNTTNE